ncbi:MULTISPECIES: type B 50S ribosomal protein L31 [unclassified Streptomyces]|uniref:type B 50S ribosomal protein L31 n=1 Tax=unclassified Streptomyces TaxID=2593676 RepID=UPI00225B7754|nr:MULTISPECIES: type B 50S ribosomal protein L31 [unclassified Streptomyces]MCX5144815.1 type B 50S ribosomal protein L31 [Streptomyces sp. NBC_00338]WRZ62923.1 type B 50S ribosomal protein L31 [Streptomyces sp. NBC_01257]WSU56891.1 type B 50S ribosomal protein L31 [Streptomyces sp. NBC_01104]
MKSRIHPVSRPVVFRDRASGAAFLTRSTADSDQRVTWEDGRSYPVIDVETSSASHPFYTGNQQVLDTAGRIEQFNRRYGTGVSAPGA